MTTRLNTEPRLLWTDSRVATEMGLPTKRVQQLARRGILPAFKIGRIWRFDPEAIRRWVAMNSRNVLRDPVASSQIPVKKLEVCSQSETQRKA